MTYLETAAEMVHEAAAAGNGYQDFEDGEPAVPFHIQEQEVNRGIPWDQLYC